MESQYSTERCKDALGGSLLQTVPVLFFKDSKMMIWVLEEVFKFTNPVLQFIVSIFVLYDVILLYKLFFFKILQVLPLPMLLCPETLIFVIQCIFTEPTMIELRA